MFNHHTKTKGDLGVLKAKLDLFQKGFLIFELGVINTYCELYNIQ